MSHNTFGHLFRVTTWGESHGPALGVVVDGCPPGIRFGQADIQAELDRRRPGQSRFGARFANLKQSWRTIGFMFDLHRAVNEKRIDIDAFVRGEFNDNALDLIAKYGMEAN